MSTLTRCCRFAVDEAAEWLVLAAVLTIAAVASYLHLRDVWHHTGAPIPDFGPLLVDGLFAAAWLRMRRRRREDTPVGVLAWFALALALAATVAGNIAAAWIAGHRDPLSLMVAAWPALAFALVWELVTGHGRAVDARQPVETAATAAPEPTPAVAEPAAAPPAPAAQRDEPPGETEDERRKREQRDRAKRARLHRGGDHTTCNPQRCPEARRLAVVAS